MSGHQQLPPFRSDQRQHENSESHQTDGGSNDVKYCGVCGDIAKSYHFGGLSCDSCKAFFRRSVQNDNYVHFQCRHSGQCLITMGNRKSCQYCRMQRCFAIGMEKSWVMTEEERKALMKARAEKKLNKHLEQRQQQGASLADHRRPSYSKSGDEETSTSTNSGLGADCYVPRVEQMGEYLQPLEIKDIESIVTKYLHAYQQVPYRTELRQHDDDRPGVQVMEMFGTLIRRFAYYSRLMADFASLPFSDQSILLKGGVLEMCLLRGALAFDPRTNHWPNPDVMSVYKDAPKLQLGNITNLVSSELFTMHMEFIACIQQMDVDEPTIMLLVMIVLFTPEREGLQCADWIDSFQSYYTVLLKNYMNWRFGRVKAQTMFSKLLTKLSDLRELSDTHNHANLRLGSDEIATIQHQLKALQLNPYPECEVVSEAPTTQEPSSGTEETEVDFTRSYLSPKIVSSAIADSELSAMASPMAATDQTRPSSRTAVGQLPSSVSASRYAQYHTSNEGQSPLSLPISQQQQMAQQFMHAMQRSVSQVASTPQFGFEWVKPDYPFNPYAESSTSSAYDHSAGASSSEISRYEAIMSRLHPSNQLNEQEMATLYNALEEFASREAQARLRDSII